MFDGLHGCTRSIKFGPNEEVPSKSAETCHPESCHWHWFGGNKRIQYYLCRINFIQRKSDCEIASNMESSSRRWDGEYSWRHPCTQPSFMEKIIPRTALRQKYREEANCTEIVRRDLEIDSRTKFGDLGSVRIKLVNFHIGKAVPGERQRSNQAHESKSFCILRLCIVRRKNERIPTFQRWMGKQTTVV